MDVNTKTCINIPSDLGVGETRNMKLGRGNVTIQVADRRAMINKYTATITKKAIGFSKETYSIAYNKFGSFVSANQTPGKITKNVEGCGCTVQEAKNITTSTHILVGTNDTREALKQLFEVREGEISSVYERGNNDQLLLVVLDKIHPKDYRAYDDPQAKGMLKAEVMRDKKAEQLMAKAKDVKSVSIVKAKGATVAPVNQVTFSAPVFVMSAGAGEPALSGAVVATKKGQFSAKPVKGNAGVYVLQIINRTTHPDKFEVKAEEDKARQKALQSVGNFINELVIKAGVADDRYLFF